MIKRSWFRAGSSALLSLCLLGCRPDGIVSFPGCSLPSGRLHFQSVTMEAVQDRVVRLIRFEVTRESWFSRITDRHSVFSIELEFSAPAGYGSYECGDDNKPCQATVDIVGSQGPDGPISLTGRISVTAAGRLSAELINVAPTSRSRPCPEIRFLVEGVSLARKSA